MSPSTTALVWFWTTTSLLAILLYWPVHRMIWVMRVRKLEAKTGQKATDDEVAELSVKTRLAAGFIVITFAFLFNHFVSRS